MSRVLIVGCGSIGARRARILMEMGHEVVVCDQDNDRAALLGRELWGGDADPGCWAPSTWTVYMKNALQHKPDVVLICTPTEFRRVPVEAAVSAKVRGLFVEKPIAVDEGTLEQIQFKANAIPVTMGACNMRFDRRLNGVELGDAKWVTARMGQAKRHWSPNHQPISMVLDDIHELDLIRHLCGPITGVQGSSDEGGSVYHTLHADDVHGVGILDRWTDPPTRSITFYRDGVDPEPRSITLWPPDMEMYEREMRHFMDCVESGEPTCNPLEQAVETNRWALRIAEPTERVCSTGGEL